MDRWYPGSKRCACCGHILERLPLDIRRWSCPEWEVNMTATLTPRSM
nr:transposase [Azotobacter beijerinckii]